MNWQPMETAPRIFLANEGQKQELAEVLVYNRENGRMAYGAVYDFNGHGALDDGTGGVTGPGVLRNGAPFVATHWCYPEPPE